MRLQGCLQVDPEKRLTCSELLRLPYLAGVEATIPATILKAQVAIIDAAYAYRMIDQPRRAAYPPCLYAMTFRLGKSSSTACECKLGRQASAF